MSSEHIPSSATQKLGNTLDLIVCDDQCLDFVHDVHVDLLNSPIPQLSDHFPVVFSLKLMPTDRPLVSSVNKRRLNGHVHKPLGKKWPFVSNGFTQLWLELPTKPKILPSFALALGYLWGNTNLFSNVQPSIGYRSSVIDDCKRSSSWIKNWLNFLSRYFKGLI